MLKDLRIKNFAIIEEQDLSFVPGLTVISGETGAGKSIVLQALEIILGGKTSQKYIRGGAEAFEVEAVFDLSTLPEEIRSNLPDICEGDELLVSRRLNQAGKNKISINGRLATLALLHEVVSKLLNICSQGQAQKLLDAKYHRELLDSFAANDQILATYQDLFRRFQQLTKSITEIEASRARNLLRSAELENIINELKELNLSSGLRAELESQISSNSNVEKITKLAGALLEELNSESGIYSQLRLISINLAEIQKLSPNLNFKQELINANEIISEIENALSSQLNQLEIDPEKLEELRERLSKLAACERKYRTDVDGLIALSQEAEKELLSIDCEATVEKLQTELREVKNKLEKQANLLSKSRQKAGLEFAKIVMSELNQLALGSFQLHVELIPSDFGMYGNEDISFLISSNKGEKLRALQEIASGGELSRIMLVLKKVLKEKSGVQVMVFDEIDTGVSGSVARRVGEKLKELASESQVIVITHLAQVASLADCHLLVEKQESLERTISLIREITGSARVREIARMLAGYKITEASLESAKELLSS